MAGVVAAEPASGAPLTVLGLALGDEAVSTQLAAAWVVYPTDLHQALADDLYARLYDNTCMEGAEEQLGAAMGFLCALYRELDKSFNATDFWANSAKFARVERKLASSRLPGWLPPLHGILATAVRERAGQAPGQSIADTRKIVSAAVPTGVRSRRQEFNVVEAAIRPAYPAGASIGYRARMVAATWSLRMALYVAKTT
jgi:hypothetical protein